MAFEAPESPHNASDPDATFVNVSCLDLLLIEIVPMAHRLTAELNPSGAEDSNEPDDDETRDAAFRKQEAVGFRVGQGLVERYRLCSN